MEWNNEEKNLEFHKYKFISHIHTNGEQKELDTKGYYIILFIFSLFVLNLEPDKLN